MILLGFFVLYEYIIFIDSQKTIKWYICYLSDTK